LAYRGARMQSLDRPGHDSVRCGVGIDRGSISGQDVSGQDVSGQDFSGQDFSGQDFSGQDFSLRSGQRL
jgi:uncharacterized protein YjbI with pentapeptide repeats